MMEDAPDEELSILKNSESDLNNVLNKNSQNP